MKLTEHQITERRHLGFAKFFIVGVVLLLILSPGTLKYWPLVYWPMYSGGQPKIPQTIGRIKLRVLDITGQWHILSSKDIYTLDDDTSIQRPGTLIILRSFGKQLQKRQIYRPYLVKQIETILGIKVEIIQAWQYTWNINFDVYPPLQLNNPETMTKLGSFKASDYPIKSQDR